MCRLLLKYNSKNPFVDDGQTFRFNAALALMKNGGPDGSKTKIAITKKGSIHLGHNRLSIQDLSHDADQPMEKDGIYLLFNGEIYNFKELREKYRLPCKTTGDTEVILEMYLRKGIKMIHELDGEYAIVIYDSNDNKIYASRDPLGIKPLYVAHDYGSAKGTDIYISSEIKAIIHLMDHKSLNKPALKQFKALGYSRGGRTLFKGIEKIYPGQTLRFNLGSTRKPFENIELREESKLTARHGQIKDVLESAVKKRMISDVPVSCTLSGGLDSSLIAWLMSKQTDQPINTYTIGFAGYENEFEKARRVADFIKSNHTEIEIDPSEIMKSIDDIVEVLEEPMDKGSSILTYFLAKSIREKVTMIGEGADELFGGYNRHQEQWDHPVVSFEKYFDKYLRVFPGKDYPIFGNLPMGNEILKVDLRNEIPNYHTLRIDKMMMNAGVEARVPFLDPEVVRVALGKQGIDKVHPEKRCLREAFRHDLPDWFLNPKKEALKIPYDRIVERYDVKGYIMSNDRILKELDIKKKYIEELYEGDKAVRNRGRILWNTFLLIKWYELNFK